MNDKMLALGGQLAVVTFARVTCSVANDKDLFYYKDADGFSAFSYDPDFHTRRAQMTPGEWNRTERSYHFFYGFAHATVGDIHFDKKGHQYQSESYSGLGIVTKQFAMDPPARGTWIVGITEPGRKGLHFRQWSRCTEAEKIFAEFLLARKSTFTEEELQLLCIHRHPSRGENSLRLRNMAILLLARNLDHFLKLRVHHGGNSVDEEVYELCQRFDPDLWVQYEEMAREQKLDPFFKFSRHIPAPAPKPIVELRAVESDGAPTPLNTPFAGLKLC